MQQPVRIIKTLFSKASIIIYIIILGACVFFFKPWFVEQYHKCLGVYDVYLGDKAYKHGDLQKAIDYYKKGLEFYPKHYEAWYNLGNIYVSYEDYYAAADAYEHAIQNKKNYTLARMNLGIVSAEKLGDFDAAISQYKSIIDSKSFLWFIPFVFSNKKSEKLNRGLAYYNMGVAYREKSLYGDEDKLYSNKYLEDAIHAYKNAARILKDDYDTLYNLAMAYQLTGDYSNAGLNYCKAISIKPMDYEAHYNLAILLRHLKMYKESYNELEKATILVSNTSSDPFISSYVFSVLNDVSRILIDNGQYKYLVERLDNDPTSNNLTYVHGKIVASDTLDRAILKNLKTCQSEDYFKNN